MRHKYGEIAAAALCAQRANVAHRVKGAEEDASICVDLEQIYCFPARAGTADFINNPPILPPSNTVSAVLADWHSVLEMLLRI